ncbi:MAG: hypothetical protein L6262_02910 [Weeksellaceae bacterium]|nr:hypothetical protein [Weeksellaceae bacterium]
MKKIMLGLAMILGTMTYAQDYYDTYPSEYNGYEYYDSSYDYPDEYYYNYPTDYYPDEYYQEYYNDYQKVVVSVNWNQFFVQYHLSPIQINRIIVLNKRFASYNAWNSYYRWNPNRWYYDRFYALQSILGPRVFVVYQKVYFHGASPFVFYRNRCVNFYARRYPVRPVYRNVNINVYRVNRTDFKESFRNTNRNANMITPSRTNESVRNQSTRSGANGNLTGGVRAESNAVLRSADNSGRNQGGMRSGTDNVRTQAPNNDKVRSQNSSVRQNQNFERKADNRSNMQRNSAPRSENNGRNSGARFTSR